MVNYLKRCNRGIVLAIIATISLMIFVAYDEASFRNKDVDLLRGQMEEYLTGLSVVSRFTEEGTEAQIEQYKDLIDRFMTYPISSSDGLSFMSLLYGHGGYYVEKSYFLSKAKMLEESKGYVTKYDFKINHMEFTKEGPGLASVYVSYNITVETKGGVTVVPLPDDMYYMGLTGSTNWVHDEHREEYDMELRHSVSGNLNLEAKKTNGVWRFYGVGGWSHSGSPTILSGTPPSWMGKEEIEDDEDDEDYYRDYIVG
jgi:hypothetical protein